jgi:SAM-dependent methyltransferase
MVAEITPQAVEEPPAVPLAREEGPAVGVPNGERLAYESQFHDQWAHEMDLDSLDPERLFSCPTTPENVFSRRRLGDLQGKMLMDLGCGPGESSVGLALAGARVAAVDISPGMLEVARQLAERYGVADRVTTHCMPAEALGFPDAYFDVIYGRDVLHHTNLERSIPEIARVLKPGGMAIFTEPLGHNPIIEVYRRLASVVRTPFEEPLTYSKIRAMRRYFARVEHTEFQFLTLGIFLWFFFGERAHPSKVRYWKKIVVEADRYAPAFRRLQNLDERLFRFLPFLRRYCWNTVIELYK